MRIGDSLIESALSLLNAEGVAAKIVELGSGNEQASGSTQVRFFAKENGAKTSEKMIDKDRSFECLLSLLKGRNFNS